jgi:hypothetical protein
MQTWLLKALLPMLFIGLHHAAAQMWVEHLRASLESALAIPIGYKASGPQHLFFTDQDLPESSEMRVPLILLNQSRTHLSNINENLALVSTREPYRVYIASLDQEAHFMTNSTLRRHYAQILTGERLITPSTNRPLRLNGSYSSTIGSITCTSLSSASSSSIACYKNGRKISETTCTWVGNEIVCNSW